MTTYFKSADCKRLILAAAWTLLLLAGCSGAPTEGDEQTGTTPNTDLGAIGGSTPDIADTVAIESKKYEGPVWFEVVEDTNIDFVHSTGNTPKRPFPAANGSGIAAFDFDLDGWLDVYFLTGRKLPLQDEEAPPRNQLYQNRGGWKFENVSTPTGLDLDSYSAGVSVGDFNGDGFPDLYIGCVGKNVLFENMGDGTFQQVPESSGANVHGFSASTAMFDYDNDGHLDLYTTHYAAWNPEKLFNRPCGLPNNPQFCGPLTHDPATDALLKSNGAGQFLDTTAMAGVTEPKARGQGIIAADLNDDGKIDFYLGNDMDPNALFANKGDGTFRNLTESSGGAYSNTGVAQAGMGVDAADVDGDMRMDLIVTNFEAEHNALYINGGNEYYDDLSARMGVMSEGMPYVGWGVCLVDFDLDTWCDLVVTNGHLEENRPKAAYRQPPLAYRNTGKGRFRFLGAEAGPHFQVGRPGRALAVGDFDNDGDSDLTFGYQDEAPALIRNNRIKNGADDAQPEAASITVRLVGVESNRDAIGADVVVTTTGRSQRHQRKGGGSYLSANDARLTIAVSDVAELEIRWPSQKKSTVKDLQAGFSYVIVEPMSAGDPPAVHKMERQP